MCSPLTLIHTCYTSLVHATRYRNDTLLGTRDIHDIYDKHHITNKTCIKVNVIGRRGGTKCNGWFLLICVSVYVMYDFFSLPRKKDIYQRLFKKPKWPMSLTKQEIMYVHLKCKQKNTYICMYVCMYIEL